MKNGEVNIRFINIRYFYKGNNLFLDFFKNIVYMNNEFCEKIYIVIC